LVPRHLDGLAIAGLPVRIVALHVHGLVTAGVASEDVPALLGKALAVRSTKGNPIELTPDEIEEILARAL
jgi:alcohol dehydrogenase class IV